MMHEGYSKELYACCVSASTLEGIIYYSYY